MSQITIGDTLDGRIILQNPDNAYSAIFVGEAAGATEVDRGYLKLLFTGIAGGSHITGVVLNLYLNANSSDNTRTMYVYRLKKAIDTNATWNKYDGSTAWSTAGGYDTNDIDLTELGSISLANNESAGWKNITLSATEVQKMFNGTYTNYGLLLKMDTELNDRHRFDSLSASEANPPTWTIDYTLTTTTTSTSTSTTARFLCLLVLKIPPFSAW